MGNCSGKWKSLPKTLGVSSLTQSSPVTHSHHSPTPELIHMSSRPASALSVSQA